MASDMWVVSHTTVEAFELVATELVACIYVRSRTIVQALGFIPFPCKAVIGCHFEGSDVDGSVGKWASSNTVVDGRTVATKPPVFPHIGSKEVARSCVLGLIPPWNRAGVVAFFF